MKACLLFLLLVFAGTCAHAQKTILIANPSLHLEELSADEIQAIFTGAEVHLKGGVHPIPVLLREGPTHEAFLKEHVGKLDSSFRIGWRSLVFSGQASMPHSAGDEAEAVAYIARTPGTIGYISRAAPHENVTVVRVR